MPAPTPMATSVSKIRVSMMRSPPQGLLNGARGQWSHPTCVNVLTGDWGLGTRLGSRPVPDPATPIPPNPQPEPAARVTMTQLAKPDARSPFVLNLGSQVSRAATAGRKHGLQSCTPGRAVLQSVEISSEVCFKMGFPRLEACRECGSPSPPAMPFES